MSSILNDWEKFCDELKASGKLITENSDNEVHQLEGFRSVSYTHLTLPTS